MKNGNIVFFLIMYYAIAFEILFATKMEKKDFLSFIEYGVDNSLQHV